jgi:hypothetical protein
LLCVKTKSGAHKQLTFYFQMWKYFCRHLHSSLISMLSTAAQISGIYKLKNFSVHTFTTFYQNTHTQIIKNIKNVKPKV